MIYCFPEDEAEFGVMILAVCPPAEATIGGTRSAFGRYSDGYVTRQACSLIEVHKSGGLYLFTSCKQNLASKTFIFMRSRKLSGEQRKATVEAWDEALGPKHKSSFFFLTSGMNRRVSQDEMDNPDPETGTEMKAKEPRVDIVPVDCV